MGNTWGKSNWTARTLAGATVASGSFGLTQSINPFKKLGSWFEGLQAGYNYMFPNRVLIGAEAVFTGVAFPDPDLGFTTGGMSILVNTGETHTENVLYADSAGSRWLCARELALLCDRRLRLELQAIYFDAVVQRLLLDD